MIAKAEELHHSRGRAANIPFGDDRIEARLRKIGYNMESIPVAGELVRLLDHANLSSGGDAVDVTDEIHSEVAQLCIAVTRAMGLRLCGVDLITEQHISQPTALTILEVNSSPGLDNYAALGELQRERVLHLYTRVLQYIENAF
jgi:D-alanine-D-alanine ligase-like ATP-grasp enzyme